MFGSLDEAKLNPGIGFAVGRCCGSRTRFVGEADVVFPDPLRFSGYI